MVEHDGISIFWDDEIDRRADERAERRDDETGGSRSKQYESGQHGSIAVRFAPLFTLGRIRTVE
ncbi:hypothetical protein ACLI4Z_01820 [Natrialbaceae archaeon A-arb3/5]